MDKPSIPSPTFCVLPWMHVALRPNGMVKPCCRFEYNYPPLKEKGLTLQESLSHTPFPELREQMLRGEKPAGCTACYREEESGTVSNRTEANVQFMNIWQETPQLRYLELALGNHCNLRCRGCGSMFSTRWISDERTLGVPEEYISKISRFDFSTLEKSFEHLEFIKMIGGEPLLSPDHTKVLEFLSDRGRIPFIHFSYATNATVKASDAVLDVWSRAKSISIGVSIDGLREKNDHFRYGSQWKSVLENAHWFHEQTKKWKFSEFHIHTVISIYNVRDIPELDLWLSSEFPGVHLAKDCLRDPNWLNIRNLPEQDKEEIVSIYKAALPTATKTQKRDYESIISLIQLPPIESFDEFIKRDSALNKIEGTRLEDMDPILHASIERYLKLS